VLPLKVTTLPLPEPFTIMVHIYDVSTLTPAIAREALDFAFYFFPDTCTDYGGTVWDENAGYGYRLYPHSHRKLYLKQ